MDKILEVFWQVKVNITLLDAIEQVPSDTKFLKDLCIKKRFTSVSKKVFLLANISEILSNSMPINKDLICPIISCTIGNNITNKALLYLDVANLLLTPSTNS